jgi:hypothetical protein
MDLKSRTPDVVGFVINGGSGFYSSFGILKTSKHNVSETGSLSVIR